MMHILPYQHKTSCREGMLATEGLILGVFWMSCRHSFLIASESVSQSLWGWDDSWRTYLILVTLRSHPIQGGVEIRLGVSCYWNRLPHAFTWLFYLRSLMRFLARFPKGALAKHTLTILVRSNIGCWEPPNWSSLGVPPCFSCPRAFPRVVPHAKGYHVRSDVLISLRKNRN